MAENASFKEKKQKKKTAEAVYLTVLLFHQSFKKHFQEAQSDETDDTGEEYVSPFLPRFFYHYFVDWHFSSEIDINIIWEVIYFETSRWKIRYDELSMVGSYHRCVRNCVRIELKTVLFRCDHKCSVDFHRVFTN